MIRVAEQYSWVARRSTLDDGPYAIPFHIYVCFTDFSDLNLCCLAVTGRELVHASC